METRIHAIREAERASHTQLYTSAGLFQQGSWLEKPVKTVMDLCAHFDKTAQMRILDLGCGVGRNAIPLAAYFKSGSCRVDCVDLLPVAVQKLNGNADRFGVRDAINAMVSAIETFPIQENCYDLIVSVSALEHVESEAAFVNKLKEIGDGLKENGIVCLIVNSDVREYDPAAKEMREPQFEVNLSAAKLLELFHGFFPWKILVQKVKMQEYTIPRGDLSVKLTTNVVSFAARKEIIAPPLI